MIKCPYNSVLLRQGKPYALHSSTGGREGGGRPLRVKNDGTVLCPKGEKLYSERVKIRFYLNDQAGRIMALWSESRGEYLVADSVVAEVDACICGETDSCGEEMKRIAEFLDNPAAKAVDPDWMIDTALPCSPSKLVCLGKSYAAHAKEFDGDPVQEPAIFLKSPSAITSCSDVVLYPPGCDKLDYEIELAVVIKNVLKNASPEEAAKAISGYTLMCDYSERANQLEHGGQWTKGKSYDSFAPMGPRLFPWRNWGTAPAFRWN